MKVIDITQAELDIAALGYDEAFPTRQQETLSAIYIRLYHEMNGKPILIEDGDIVATSADIQEAFSEVNLPVKYSAWLPAIVETVCTVINVTSNSSQIVKDIGINAIDSLIDRAIEVVLRRLFSEESPTIELEFDGIARAVQALDNINASLQGTNVSLYDDSRGTLLTLRGGSLEQEAINP